MSRYHIDTQDEFDIFVGWDNPLQTFFYQKYSGYNTKNEKLLDEIGTSYHAIPDVDQLYKLIKVFGYELTDGQLSMLSGDFDNRTESTPLQKMINQMFTK